MATHWVYIFKITWGDKIGVQLEYCINSVIPTILGNR